MAYYIDGPLSDSYVSRECGRPCYSLGAGLSHERDIIKAGGELGYDGVRDPRPGKNGPLMMGRAYIDNTETIRAVDFNDKNGQYACSYTGISYNDIKDSNAQDIKKKIEQNRIENANEELLSDEYGVEKSSSENSYDDDSHNDRYRNSNGYIRR